MQKAAPHLPAFASGEVLLGIGNTLAFACCVTAVLGIVGIRAILPIGALAFYMRATIIELINLDGAILDPLEHFEVWALLPLVLWVAIDRLVAGRGFVVRARRPLIVRHRVSFYSLLVLAWVLRAVLGELRGDGFDAWAHIGMSLLGAAFNELLLQLESKPAR
jgi:hypothetical protein